MSSMEPRVIDPLQSKIRSGEAGQAVNHGWTCLGVAGDVELWGTVEIDVGEMLAYLHALAARHLPPATRYEIRNRVPGFYGRSKGTAWFRSSEMDEVEPWGSRPAGHAADGSHYLVGQFVTSEAATCA